MRCSLTTGDIDLAACRLFIEASTITAARNTAKSASLPALTPPCLEILHVERETGLTVGVRVGEDNDATVNLVK